MAAKNVYHDAVRDALVADGWTITHDPLKITVGRHKLYVDLGASRDPIAATRGDERVAVEVQSFVADSDMDSLHHAVGQYVVYRALLRQQDPTRTLFLAVPVEAARDVFDEEIGQVVVTDLAVRLAVFDPDARRFTRWTTS